MYLAIHSHDPVQYLQVCQFDYFGGERRMAGDRSPAISPMVQPTAMKYLLSLLLLLTGSLSRLYSQETDSGSATRFVDSLLQVVQQAIQEKQWEKAIEVNTLAAQESLDRLGKTSPQHVQTWIYQSKIQYFLKQYDQSELAGIRAKEILEEAGRTTGMEYCSSLRTIAYALVPQNRFEESIPWFEQTIELLRANLGNEDKDLAAVLSSFGYYYYQHSDYAHAEPLIVESVAIQRKALGPENKTYIANLLNLAILYDDMREYARAEPLFLETEAFLNKGDVSSNVNYAWLL